MFGRWLISFLLILLFLIGLLPTIVSTSWGMRHLLSWVNTNNTCVITARSLSLSWRGPQIVQGLSIGDPTKDIQLDIERFSCPNSLWRLLFDRKTLKKMDIEKAVLQLSNKKLLYFDRMQGGFNRFTQFFLNGKSTTGHFSADVTRLPSHLEAQAQFSHFPTEVLEPLISLYFPQNNGLLSTLIGSAFDCDLSLKADKEIQFLKFCATSDYFSAKMDAQIESNHFSLTSPAEIHFQLTPQLANLFHIPIALSAPIPATLELKNFQYPDKTAEGTLHLHTLPLQNPTLIALIGEKLEAAFSYKAPLLSLAIKTPSLFLEESHFQVDQQLILQAPTQLHVHPLNTSLFSISSPLIFDIDQLCVSSSDLKGEAKCASFLMNRFALEQAVVSFHLVDMTELILDLKSATVTAKVSASLGEILLIEGHCPSLHLPENSEIHDLTFNVLYNTENEWMRAQVAAHSTVGNTPGKLQLKLEKSKNQRSGWLEMEQFTSGFLDFFYPDHHQLGPLLTCSASFDLMDQAGSLNVRFHSSQARLSARGTLESGIFYPTEPLYAQFYLNSASASFFLQKLHFLPVSSFRSKDPLTLEIFPDGTSIPLISPDLKQLNISKARLELGQISCNHEGNIQSALSLLQQQLTLDKDLALWFAPIDFTIKEGVVQIERTEVLMNPLEVCLWGTLNLSRDSGHMIIGFPAQTLEKAFGIKNLPPTYILQIPMKGKLAQMKVDSGKAMGKIAALFLWQKNLETEQSKKNLSHALLGEFLGKLAVLPDLKNPAPPPKHPFPWERQKNYSKNSEKTKKIRFRKGAKEFLPLLKFLN